MTGAVPSPDLPADVARAAAVGDAMIRAPKTLPPTATVGEVRRFFEDDHVHAALVVDDGRLLAVVERADLVESIPPERSAAGTGRLEGRTVAPDAALAPVWDRMRDEGRRRLAVVDERGRCLGLLCLKRSGRGFCSDADVEDRRREREGR